MHTFLYSLFILLSSFLQGLLHKTVVEALNEGVSVVSTAHFADPKRGRISWIIDENSLPWAGQYYFIESTEAAMSNLLVVVDSSNGNHLGNCASFAPRDNKWRRFFWTLSEDSLICNITDTESIISKVNFPPENSPRSFSLRILAQHGPKCFRDMIVQNEKLEGCPPKLHRNSFQEMFLSCGCPLSTEQNYETVDSQQSVKLDKQANATSHHFVNSEFSLSNTDSAFLHEIFPQLPQNANSSLTKSFSGTEMTAGTISTNASATGQITINGNIPLPLLNPAVNAEHSTVTTPPVVHVPPQTATVTSGNGETVPLEPSVNATVITTTVAEVAQTGLRIQPCAGMQCLNNGTCVPGTDGAATCMCTEGFAGKQCEVNLCAGVHCMHDGICRITAGVPHCECQPGTTGTFCEQVLCNPGCEQGGICSLTNGVPMCHCPSGTVGVNCNIIDTCNNDPDACSEYDNDARCQLDPNSFVLISPVPVRATFKCLCLDEKSEWVECKQLPMKAQFSMTITAVSTTTPSILFPASVTSDNSEKFRLGGHLVDLINNNPHFAHLMPKSFLITHSTNPPTAPAPSFTDANNNLPDVPVNETPLISKQESVELFPGLSRINQPPPVLPTPITTTSRNSVFFSATASPFLITPSSHNQNFFNLIPQSNETLKSDAILPTTLATEHSDFKDAFNLTKSVTETATNSSVNGSEIHEAAQKNNMSQYSFPQPLTELHTTQSAHELSPNYQSPTIHLSSLTGNESVTAEPANINDNNSWGQFGTELNHSTLNVLKPEETTALPVNSATESDLSNQMVSKVSSPEKESNWNWSERNVTESTEETEQMITVEDITTESVQILGEDEVKFVKLTVGLPTTTMMPELKQRSDEAASAGSDSSRNGTSSWAIFLSVFFALMMLGAVCAVLVLRYIRRSRKLHGKYNPAREESVLSNSYTMPMTTVTKEERLI